LAVGREVPRKSADAAEEQTLMESSREKVMRAAAEAPDSVEVFARQAMEEA
jgi:hypothetical protein